MEQITTCSNQVFSCLCPEKYKSKGRHEPGDHILCNFFDEGDVDMWVADTKDWVCFLLLLLFKEMGILHETSSYVKRGQSFMEC